MVGDKDNYELLERNYMSSRFRWSFSKFGPTPAVFLIPLHKMDSKATSTFCDKFWDQDIVPTLETYITIPALSPSFDPEWKKSGHLDAAAQLMRNWVVERGIAGATVDIVSIGTLTPVLLVEVPATQGHSKNVFMYGHMDKQPPMTEKWDAGLGPWTPVWRDSPHGKLLYGRGGADDGYAVFCASCAIKAIDAQGVSRPRCVVLIEASEESGSPDLPPYIDHLKSRIGIPDLIVCLDSGAGNYEQFWMTTSLRGVINQVVRVQVLEQAMHSGSASGIVPSSFRIMRQLLSRLEDENTGRVLLPELYVDVPPHRIDEAKLCASVLGDLVHSEFPFVAGTKPVTSDRTELLLNKTWRPQLSVIGADGIPTTKAGGNVLRTETALKLSMRIPPMVQPDAAAAAIERKLLHDPPYGAKVEVALGGAGEGWNAPAMTPELSAVVDTAARTFFGGKPAVSFGEGGSIPFMAMLATKFPRAQFVITGVLGPASNAHGPNEFINVDYAKKLTAAVAHIVAHV